MDDRSRVAEPASRKGAPAMTEQQQPAPSEADRLREVLNTARSGLSYIQFFKAIGRLDEVVAACDAAFTAMPNFATEINRLSGMLDELARRLREREAEAKEIHDKLTERNEVAEQIALTAERAAVTAAATSQERIAESATRADEAILADEARVAQRRDALRREMTLIETEHEGRKMLLLQREREAREAAELAEERLRELRESIPARP
jgi:hypothetical protein